MRSQGFKDWKIIWEEYKLKCAHGKQQIQTNNINYVVTTTN